MRKKKRKGFAADDAYGFYDNTYSYNESESPYGYQDSEGYYQESTYDEGNGYTGGHGSDKGKGSSLKNLVIIAFGLIAVIFLYCVTMNIIGPSRGQCKRLIDKAQVGCNELDIKEIVNCLSPSVRNAATPFIIAEKLSGGMLQSALKTIAKGLGLNYGDDEDIESSLRNIRITHIRYGIPLPTRKVRCRVDILGIERYMTLTIKKSHGVAYIQSAELD